MRILETGVDSPEVIRQALSSGSAAVATDITLVVEGIIRDVKARGDIALLDLGRKFDSPHLESILIEENAIQNSISNLPADFLSALEHAARNIRRFHEDEKQQSWTSWYPGRTLGQIVRPIDSVGIYIPGGRAAYPSSVLMTAIPAQVAGVPEISVCTPSAPHGKIPDTVLAACRLCGVNRVYAVGGAQAIAAFALGTESVKKVDKVVGPGNQYVNVAKRLLFGHIGIDSLAGPSEVLILSDGSADPEWVAADLIAQAEHGGESKSILITDSRLHADAVLKAVNRLADTLSRSEILKQSLGSVGVVLIVQNREEALKWTNLCAPEHLQVLVENPETWLGGIRNAGAIFVGPYSPVPLGDYAAGPSHTLPTGTAARFSSALGVSEFQKRTSLIWYGPEGYPEDARAAARLAAMEGLDGHKLSLQLRLKDGCS